MSTDAASIDFFVSHAGPDRAWAEWVAWHLREAGYTVELDAWDWSIGENFVTRMHAAVDAANRVIALLSSAYFADGRYTADEWSSALIKDNTGGTRLIPVQIEQCSVPRLLGPLLRVELFGVDQEEAVRRLLAAVRGPELPGDAPVFPGAGPSGVVTGARKTGRRLPGVLPAVWNIGPRNPGFVGREADLAAIHERLRAGSAAVVQALHGMGGIGKTQLAIEYAHRRADAYDLAWWINAEQTHLIANQYAMLASELGLTGPGTDATSAISAVRGYLRGHNRWLLVLDNAGSAGDVRDWLPTGPGHTLITSRAPGWEELAASISLDVLSRPESVALLRTYRPGLDDTEADSLAAALGDLPLALAQAGGFLAETAIPAGRYLEMLAAQTSELLDQSPPHAHPHSLTAAILMATDQLAEADPAALALVRIGAFLAPEPIPTELLIGPTPRVSGGPTELEALTVAISNPVAAHRSLGRVGRYGLAQVDDGLRLHRITQAVLREQLTADEATVYHAYAQNLLVAADPGDEQSPRSWPGWTRLLPHLLATDPASTLSPCLRDLACRAPWFLHYRGQIQQAHDLSEHFYGAWRDRLGPDDPHTLRVAAVLTRTLVQLGPYDRARQLGEDTVARFRRTLGDDHPDTLTAAHVLAVCLHRVGVPQLARSLNEDTLARRRHLLGDEHQDTMATAHNLGCDIRALGEAEAARQLHEDLLARARRVRGDEHPSTLITIIELGCDLHALGHVDAALRLHEDTLAQARRILGDDHIYTATCTNELTRDLLAVGRAEEARELSVDALTRMRRVFGDGGDFTIYAANNLAAALHALGENEPARQLSQQTLYQAERLLGQQHPLTLRAANNLAAALRELAHEENREQGRRSPT